MTSIAYPRLIKRVRAALVDSILLPVAVIGMLIVGDAMGVASTFGKAMLLFMPILILEPGLVAFTGGTFGHHLLRIRVTKLGGSGNLNILAATVRFMVKLLLGWLSFILVLTTTKHQAVHDLIAGSVVIHKDVAGLPAYEVLSDRAGDDGAYVYPASWRRVSIIALYLVVTTIAIGVVGALVSSADCLRLKRCTTTDHLLKMALVVGWIVSFGWITVLGWNGRLFGCRKRPREVATAIGEPDAAPVNDEACLNSTLLEIPMSPSLLVRHGSAVRYLSPKQAVSLRPKEVGYAGWLLWTALLLGIPSATNSYIRAVAEANEATFLIVMLIVYSVAVTAIVGIGRGHNWARMLKVAMFGLGLLGAISTYEDYLTESVAYIVLDLIGFAVDGLALYLVFSHPGLLWFRRRQEVP